MAKAMRYIVIVECENGSIGRGSLACQGSQLKGQQLAVAESVPAHILCTCYAMAYEKGA